MAPCLNSRKYVTVIKLIKGRAQLPKKGGVARAKLAFNIRVDFGEVLYGKKHVIIGGHFIKQRFKWKNRF